MHKPVVCVIIRGMKSIVKFGCAGLLLMLSAVHIGVGAQEISKSPVKITEIQYYGSVGIADSSLSDPGIVNRWDKWVELTNITQDPVDLEGYSLQFGSGVSEYHTFDFGVATLRPRTSIIVGMDRAGLVSSVRPAYRTSSIKNISRTSQDTYTRVALTKDAVVTDAVQWGESNMNSFEQSFLSQHAQYTKEDLWNTVGFSMANINGVWSPSNTAYVGNNYGNPGTAIMPVLQPVAEPVREEIVPDKTPIQEQVITEPVIKPVQEKIPAPVQTPVPAPVEVQAPITAPEPVSVSKPVVVPQKKAPIKSAAPAMKSVPATKMNSMPSTEAIANVVEDQKPVIALAAVDTQLALNPGLEKRNFLQSVPSVAPQDASVSALMYEFDIPWESVMYGSMSIALLALSQLVGWNIGISEYSQGVEAESYI